MKLRLVAAVGISLSCVSCASLSYRSVDIDSHTGRFPTAASIPDSEILQYKPTDISNLSIVYLSTSTRDSLKAKQHEFMLTSVRKIGTWRVTDNVGEAAAACGIKTAESVSLLGSMGCQLLTSPPQCAEKMVRRLNVCRTKEELNSWVVTTACRWITLAYRPYDGDAGGKAQAKAGRQARPRQMLR
ncbi:MAG TPA: hypothetical protein VI078_09900 [bacterium]